VTDSACDLVRDVRSGHREAFGRLIEIHQRRLFGLVLLMIRQPAGAEDVTQEAFVRAYRQLHHYDDRRPFYPWLATIGIRLARNWLRQHNRISRREGTPLETTAEPEVAEGALPALIADEEHDELWRAVATLPSGERTAVYLYYRDEMPVRDIAVALGVSPGTIKTLLFRARRHLRTLLQSAGAPSHER
jgi:RNA polymerase sigma-70 factor, ECF subfamily